MSLPLLVSRGGGGGTSNGARFRGGSAGTGGKAAKSSVHSADHRSSIDTEARPSAIGFKRSSSSVESAPSAPCLTWQQLLDPTPSVPASDVLRLPQVCVCGMSDLGVQLAECLASKAGVAVLGLHDDATDLTKFGLLPDVYTYDDGIEAASWADLIILCGSYEEGHDYLSLPGMRRHLRGKVVLQLANGTPQEAAHAAALVRQHGASYLDGCLLSDPKRRVFGGGGSCVMVSGDKAAWHRYSHVITAAAPAAFYGGKAPEHANAVSVAICAFMSSVYMGLQQSLAITTRFGVPSYLLPRLLAGSFMPVIKRIISHGAPPLATALSHSRGPSTSLSRSVSTAGAAAAGAPVRGALPTVHEEMSTGASASASAAVGQPTPGSPAWRAQLERIRRVCNEAGVEHSIIDGFLASQACGGSGALTASVPPPEPASSVGGGLCTRSDSLDSWVNGPDSCTPKAQGKTGLGGKVVSALDLLDLDAFGMAGAQASQLGVELMDGICLSNNVPQVAWAP